MSDPLTKAAMDVSRNPSAKYAHRCDSSAHLG